MGTFLIICSLLIDAVCVSFLINILIRIMNKEDGNYNILKVFTSAPIIFIVFGINNIITLYLPNLLWIKSILFICTGPVISIYIYKSTFFKGLCSTVVTSMLSALINILLILIIKYLDIEPGKLISNNVYIALTTFVVSSFEFAIYLIMHSIYKLCKDGSKFCFFNFRYLVPQLITVAFCMLSSMSILMINDFKYSRLFIIINLLQLIVISVASMLNSKNAIKYESTQLELDNTLQHNETLLKVNEGVRGFKHDMTNIVQAILGYVACKDLNGVKKYCENLVVGFNDINILSILSPTVINEPAIYGVVVNKILAARSKGMNLSLDANLRANEINFPKFELSIILGILLDNAIEAGEITEDKKLILDMHASQNEAVDIISVSNSIKDTNIDISKLFEKDYSTKEKPSGFGLYEVSKFFKKYNQGNITTSIDFKSKLLTQTIKIKHTVRQLTIDDLILEA